MLAVLPATAAEPDSAVRSAEYIASDAHTGAVAVSYTTGASGHQLKWLPYRPSKQIIEKASVDKTANGPLHAAAATEADVQSGPLLFDQTVRPGAVLAVQSGGAQAAQPDAAEPFSDPFGDTHSQPSPPAQLNNGMLEKSRPQPLPAEAMPQLLAQPNEAADATAESEPLAIPSLEQELAAAPLVEAEECPSPDSVLKQISEIDYKIAPKAGEFPQECPIGEATFYPRAWAPVTFAWTASSLCHKPLYFEDVHLERYGHSWGPFLQPLMSAGHFFLTVPAAPYLMGAFPPTECIYTLGYYRPGNCAPYLLDPIPLSVRGAVIEGAVWTGMAFLIP